MSSSQAREVLYTGRVIPVAVEQRIRGRAIADSGVPNLEDAFTLGALAAYCGRDIALAVAGAECDAFRRGQQYGASLRPRELSPLGQELLSLAQALNSFHAGRLA